MLVAVDTNGIRYISTDITTIHREKGFYICQECKQPIFLRLCLNKMSHFAHYPDDKECAGAWEPDTEMHSMMKQDVYDYFKKLSWIKRIELEYPIDVKGKIYLPDIYIETDQNQKIAVECQAHIVTRDALLKRALTYNEGNIYPLFILEAGEFLGEFITPRDDLYISPRFEEKSKGEEAFIQRFYIYDPNRKSLNGRKDIIDLNKDMININKDIIYSIDVAFARIPSSAPIGTHIETYETKTDFSSYKINISKTECHSKDDLLLNEIPMVVDMQLPNFEELRERLRQLSLNVKKKEDGLTIVEKESQRNKEEELQRKREEEARKIDELRLQNLKKKLDSIDIDEPWALYANYPGASSPTLLPPLVWKGGDQTSNLKSMLTFFKKFIIPDKTKIMIYKSVCGSGKSASILHAMRGLGRGIIVTPFKALQRQYSDDYFKGNKFVMKKDGTPLKVAVLLGRGNFECKWLAEQYDYQQRLIEESKKPENAGMYVPIDDFILNTYRYDKSAANRRLPCTRPLQLVRSGKRGPRWVSASTCLHPNTDILTPDGIKKIKDINIGDRVYSVNLSNMNNEIDIITDKRKSHADSLIRFHNQGGCDVKVTKDHIMIFKTSHRVDKICKLPALNLCSYNTRDTRFIKPHNISHDYEYMEKIKIGRKTYDMNDFLTLLGWYISEGWMTKKDITSLRVSNQMYDLDIEQRTIKARYSYCKISQDPSVNEKHFDDIANLLDKMKIRHFFDGYWSFVISDSDMANALIFYGGAKSINKFIHKDIFKLPKEQLIYLLDSLIKGDGHVINYKLGDAYRYSTVSDSLTNDIILLSNILGYRTSVSTFIGMKKVYISDIRDYLTGHLRVDPLEYSGDVYDIEVAKNHNYFAGNDGKFVLVHNCPYWIPTPTSKQTIDQWQKKAINKEKGLEEQFNDDATEEGENIPDIQQNAPTVSKTKTRLDVIQERVKCSTIKYYDSVAWGQVGIFIRDEANKDGSKCQPVCPYYQQFYSYIDADVIVMNSAKWHLETRIGRKPLTDVEVFDEGDYWLDSQASEIEFQRSTIDRIVPPDNKMQRMKTRALEIFDLSLKDIKSRIEQQRKGDDRTNIVDAKAYNGLFTAMTETLVELIKSLEDDERIEEKLVDINTIIRYIDKASISYIDGKRKETKVIKVFIPYPDYILKELFGLSSKNIIITSGTMHSGNVLSTLFGINEGNYTVEILQGRKENPGKLTVAKPKDGLSRVTYSLWENSPQFKEWYSKTLNYILDNLKVKIDQRTGKPGEGKILVLTPAKKYADPIRNRPDVYVDFAKSNEEEEDMSIKINTTLSDYVNNTLEDVRKVKEGDINIDGDVLRTNKQIILSTRLVRGADLRDDRCRAVVMTKWPYPDVSAGYNQALKKRFGSTIFDKIMSDKAEREGIQYVSRGLRHDLDWEIFSTPDEKAYNNVFRLFSYDK